MKGSAPHNNWDSIDMGIYRVEVIPDAFQSVITYQWGYLLYIGALYGFVIQIYIPDADSGDIYIRSRYGNNQEWRNWSKFSRKSVVE